MAPHPSTLAWKIPWMEEPGGLQSMWWLRVGHDWVTSLSLFTFIHFIGEGNGNPLQCSCLENPREGGALWAAAYGVAQSRTRLKWLSNSSSSILKNNSFCMLTLIVYKFVVFTYHFQDNFSWFFGIFYIVSSTNKDMFYLFPPNPYIFISLSY